MRENEHRGCGVNVEVEEFDGRADEACEQHPAGEFTAAWLNALSFGDRMVVASVIIMVPDMDVVPSWEADCTS